MKEQRLRSALRQRTQFQEEQILETATNEEKNPSSLTATPDAL